MDSHPTHDDVLATAAAWLKQGRRLALATVVSTWGSAPRPAGSQLIIDRDGNFEGSVSGGCVEGAVVVAAIDVIDSYASKLLDFGVADETLLSEGYDRPLMVDRYPTAVKAFYMQPDPERPEVAMGVDVLAPEGYGEIIGGGQRIHDAELLLRRIEEHNLPKDAFNWYIDLRKYGSVPHGGFGMGIERCVAWLCGLEHLREAIAFPRMIYRLRP